MSHIQKGKSIFKKCPLDTANDLYFPDFVYCKNLHSSEIFKAVTSNLLKFNLLSYDKCFHAFDFLFVIEELRKRTQDCI